MPRASCHLQVGPGCPQSPNQNRQRGAEDQSENLGKPLAICATDSPSDSNTEPEARHFVGREGGEVKLVGKSTLAAEEKLYEQWWRTSA